jgi:hypothetical protein
MSRVKTWLSEVFRVNPAGLNWPRGVLFLTVTLVAGLSVAYGVRRFVWGSLLSIWFIIPLGNAFTSHHHAQTPSYTWAQVLAWIGGAVIRALVIAATVAIAFGADLPHGYWMTIAAIVATKPSLEQTTVVGVQRIAGALMGAAAAILLLLIPASETGANLTSITHGLETVALVFLMYAAALQLWNHAVFFGALTAAVLIDLDLRQPANYGAEGGRVLWTLCGVAIA